MNNSTLSAASSETEITPSARGGAWCVVADCPEWLTLAARALLAEIRALTAAGGVYPNQPKDSALEVLLDELIHEENLVDSTEDGVGWIAVAPE
jgi:hypothetical protein